MNIIEEVDKTVTQIFEEFNLPPVDFSKQELINIVNEHFGNIDKTANRIIGILSPILQKRDVDPVRLQQVLFSKLEAIFKEKLKEERNA